MDNRLQALAAWVREGSVLADIGTDHAYLPIHLVSVGRCPSAIACDLREGPLENAKNGVSAAGLSDRISCRLGDGLSPLSAGEAQDIVIAGMGGETIAAILEAANWVKDPALRFLFQPMTRAEHLRRYLLTNGYTLLAEKTVTEGGHTYLLICAAWTDAPCRADEETVCLGLLSGETDRSWLLKKKEQWQKMKTGRLAAGDTAEAARLSAILEKLEERLG